MNPSPESLHLISGLLSFGSVFAAVWLGRSTLSWVLDRAGYEGEAGVVWTGRDRRLAWIALSGATCLALLQIVSVVLALIELPAFLARPEADRLIPTGWGAGGYELYVGLRVLWMALVYALAGRLAGATFRARYGSTPRPANGRGAARITLLLIAGGLAFVLADGIGSGVQALPVYEWVAVPDPLAGYLAGWAVSLGLMAGASLFMYSRQTRSE